MLTGLFQKHVRRVSMPTLNDTLTLKAVKHGTHSDQNPIAHKKIWSKLAPDFEDLI